MEIRKRYKIVRRLGPNELVSSAVEGRARVKYYPLLWRRAPYCNIGYGICVFETLIQAAKYLGYDCPNDYEIWECETRGEYDKLPHANSIYWLCLNIPVDKPDHLIEFPRGTVMAQEAKITKKVPSERWYKYVQPYLREEDSHE